MLLGLLLLSISVSIDSFGIGITYGLKNTYLSKTAKWILCIISLTMTTIAIYFGEMLSCFFPDVVTKWLGTLLLIFMGCFIIFQSLTGKKEKTPFLVETLEPSIHEFFIRSLGMTIQIIRNPISSDIDGSKRIDAKEAIYLGIALSIDSLCIGIGGSMIGLHSIFFPLFVTFFQLFFLSLGRSAGKKIANMTKIPDKIWNLISGALLILIGFSRIYL